MIRLTVIAITATLVLLPAAASAFATHAAEATDLSAAKKKGKAPVKKEKVEYMRAAPMK